ncbi:O-antigen ligase family protein [Methylobacterium brachythecii]|uniref:Ligase n=1 Tax=Methylobacterium brachythecii TaxID=1176177 RepID=A0A7W6F8K9_9HYPH|nr:O-antigen ligase [Methylobacterium brachythecii]MBB3904578.1 O-antigen ligase [Methylobacterium brachythecii]GLS46359.1 ligase [Methylobacterium brachythecii]
MTPQQPAFGARRPAASMGVAVPTSNVLGHLREFGAGLSVLRLARQALFLAALLLALITLKPFADLSRLDVGDLVTGQETMTYATFGALALAGLLLAMRDHGRALASLVTPTHLALVAWLGVSVVLSQDHATSGKRLALTAAVMLLTACLPLLAQTRTELRNLLAIATLVLLAVCYVGMIVAPEFAVHQARDLQEPGLAGNWRGSFGHKNAAAAVMAMLLFVGVAVFRAGGRVSGLAILGLSCVFLVGSEGKSSFALSLTVFALTGAFAVVRSFGGRMLVAIGPVLLLNVFTVGTVMSDGLASIVSALPIDSTFTGRTDIWRFSIATIAARPITGYGFAAFWGTQTVRDVSDEGATWAGYASHSHNGYVDTTLTMGAVGLFLLLIVFVLGPLRNYQRLQFEAGNTGPFATMFLQIWLFGILLSSMESFFFDRSDVIWVLFLFAVFGLHFLARFRTR